MNPLIEELTTKALTGGSLDRCEGEALWKEGLTSPFLLMAKASEIRENFKGRKVNLCSIVNAKSGICPENCRFCAQSAHHSTDAPVYPLISAEAMIAAAAEARGLGAHCFGIVTSGTSIATEAEWQEIYKAVEGINKLGIRPCGSLGMLDRERARKLKEAGLFRYHHNLETSRSFFPFICTTHEYQEDIDTNMAAKEAGLSTCCGGIIGLGETMEQRIELALTLQEMDVDSVPINILNAIPGTPLEGAPPLRPMEILITIALFRFILPSKDIRLCGGKEKNLRQLLPLAVMAGCNGFMTGNYLTTPGREPRHDVEMIEDLDLEPVFE